MATEKRLIDANKARVVAQRIYSDPVLVHVILNTLNETPTVDAVEVVRCVNCQSHEPCEVRNRVWCRTMGRYMKEDGFCSEGVENDA